LSRATRILLAVQGAMDTFEKVDAVVLSELVALVTTIM
jgi:hypothetical protein